MIIDISQEVFSCRTFPGDPKRQFRRMTSMDGGADYNLTEFTMCAHNGTHIDAPYHYLPEGKRITDYPVSRFIGEGIVLDLRHKKAGEAITKEDLMPLQKTIREGDFLVLQTGWCEKYGEEEYLNHPYLTKDAAQQLVNLGVRIVAVDFLNVDPTLWEQWDVHPVLLGNEVLIVENLNNTLQLDTGKRYCFCFAPIKLQGSDGGPVRAFAVER